MEGHESFDACRMPDEIWAKIKQLLPVGPRHKRRRRPCRDEKAWSMRCSTASAPVVNGRLFRVA
ncbi:MAG: hypothetical protein KatS3mg109_1778 [Pirellulaceae bacterium]|nr:MAG: hypothetical protein KatS3mg109_1778 [Pirellulaceae bacterium]